MGRRRSKFEAPVACPEDLALFGLINKRNPSVKLASNIISDSIEIGAKLPLCDASAPTERRLRTKRFEQFHDKSSRRSQAPFVHLEVSLKTSGVAVAIKRSG